MKRDRSRTGRRKGFTLVEALLAVAILASGSLVLAPSFLKASDLTAGLSQRYQAELLMGNLVAQTESALQTSGTLDSRPETGTARMGGNNFSYSIVTELTDRVGLVYRVDVQVVWRDSSERTARRTGYIIQ